MLEWLARAGEAPDGHERLILGHESLGRVREAPNDCGFAADDHIVGITVGRLRRKLADSGASIRTVPRRGYCLEAAVAAS